MVDDLQAREERDVRRIRRLHRATCMLCDFYEDALQKEWVKKPLAYALYRLWKIIDEEEW